MFAVAESGFVPWKHISRGRKHSVWTSVSATCFLHRGALSSIVHRRYGDSDSALFGNLDG